MPRQRRGEDTVSSLTSSRCPDYFSESLRICIICSLLISPRSARCMVCGQIFSVNYPMFGTGGSILESGRLSIEIFMNGSL